MIIYDYACKKECFGFIESSVGLMSYVLETDARGSPILDSLRLDQEMSRIIKSTKYDGILSNRLQNVTNLIDLDLTLENIVGLAIEKSNCNPTKNDLINHELIFQDISAIGWDRVKNLRDDLGNLQLSILQNNIEHIFDIEIDSKYPIIEPIVTVSLPVPFNLKWKFNSHLIDIYHQVSNVLMSYDCFFKVLKDLDDNTWILEPETPTFSTIRRRIALERNCSVNIEIKPDNPLAVCEMTFLGPSNHVSDLRIHLSQNIHKWSKERLLRENLSAVLGVRLPPKPSQASSPDSSSIECAICYNYSLQTNELKSSSHAVPVPTSGSSTVSTSRSCVPDQVCPNEKCSRMYHTSCLLEWLQSIPTTRTSFGTLFGQCPYCQESLSVRMLR